MPNLYPTFEVPEDIADETVGSPEVELNPVRTALFDFENGKTFLDQKGRVRLTANQDAYRQWVTKCVLTERYEYLAYGPDFGVEVKAIMRANYPRDIAESEIERTIREALMVDHRTVSVENFSFDWLGDSVRVKCLVTSIYDQEEFNFTFKR